MKNKLKKLITKLPFLKNIYTQLYPLFVPRGHFYSPIPSTKEIRLKEEEIFGKKSKELPSINLNEEYQLSLFEEFKKYYNEQPFPNYKNQDLRYFFENNFYAYSDAIFLYCMIRHYQPKKIIEIGSGYSSCVILDTNELFFDNAISCAFIEPYPDRLLSLLTSEDRERFQLIQRNLQDIELTIFQELSNNDILFVDSTHVSKTNSDVNYLLFNILPSLNTGVLIHFHDIFYPFEYPKEWVYEGRAWNEAYILRAFLQYNNAFKIEFFNTFLESFYPERFFAEMPLCMKNTGGSIWLKKL